MIMVQFQSKTLVIFYSVVLINKPRRESKTNYFVKACGLRTCTIDLQSMSHTHISTS